MGILDAINADLVLRVRLVVYGVLIFFSFFIFIGVAVLKDETVLSCPLYCDDGFKCGGASNCNYPMAISIMFQLIYLLVRIATLVLLLLGKFTPDFVLFTDMPEFIYVVVDLLAFFLTFIGACILSAGTNSTCSKYNCDHGDLSDAMSGSKAAQAGAWISTFAWLFVGILGFLHLLRSGRIPFLGGRAPAASSGGAGGDPSAPPQDTPPSHPDDPPKY